MEKTVRIIEVVFEKNETFVVLRGGRKTVFLRCGKCGRETGMAKPEDAARIVGVKTRRIYQKIEAGLIHFIEPTDAEDPLVCLDSVKKECL